MTASAMLLASCGGGASPSPTAEAPASVVPASEAPTTAANICTNPPKAEGQTLTFVSYGGAYQEAQRKGWLEPYAALTGVTFQESEDSSNATIKAQVEAG